TLPHVAASRGLVSCQMAAFYDHFGAIPRELIRDHQLGNPIQVVSTPQGLACLSSPAHYRKIPVLSVFTAMFVHAGWLHLLGNMLFLIIFGNNIEDRFGRLRYLLFYLVSGYVAAYGFAAVFPSSGAPLVGASGAIAGVLGSYLVLYPRAKVWSLVPFLLFIPLRIPAWLVLGLWFVLQWAYAFGQVTPGGGVAYVAHVFGFVFGVLVGLAVRMVSPGSPDPGQLSRARTA
ncbi:MAG TPA: rhomboid family intramembrane serine protease, partial [Streptosporangiaceae bacterium]|nr:rhomboid family intramembrane serine protease [Streptosporangiaceae bacterium]